MALVEHTSINWRTMVRRTWCEEHHHQAFWTGGDCHVPQIWEKVGSAAQDVLVGDQKLVARVEKQGSVHHRRQFGDEYVHSSNRVTKSRTASSATSWKDNVGFARWYTTPHRNLGPSIQSGAPVVNTDADTPHSPSLKTDFCVSHILELTFLDHTVDACK